MGIKKTCGRKDDAVGHGELFLQAQLGCQRGDPLRQVDDEFPLNLECALIHTLKIGLHTLFVGEILDVKAEESILNDDDRRRSRS